MIPNETLVEFAKGNIDWGNDTIKVALMKNTTEYTPDKDNHNFLSDILDGGTTGAEFDGSNYTPGFEGSGRKTLSNTTAFVDDTDDEAVLDADDVTWSSLGSSTGGQVVEAVVVFVKGSTDDTDARIIRVFDDSEETELEKQTNGEDFTWSFDAEGVMNITNA